jgi:predicted phosphodiesterase
LRASEENSFDAIIVAGDIGNESVTDFFEILATFKCPILYVYGNWDSRLGYKTSFGKQCHLIHSNVITIGNISFTGFSGCPTHWGKNPIAQSFQSQPDSMKSETLKLNKENVSKVIRKAEVDPRRCVIITHERFARLSETIPGALLHLYGHIHTFSERTFKSTRCINVAALDRPVSARPRARKKWIKDDCRNFNAGNYAIIEINSLLAINTRCVNFFCEYSNWIPLEDRQYHGIDWIPEEAECTKDSDPPLLRYEKWRTSN